LLTEKKFTIVSRCQGCLRDVGEAAPEIDDHAPVQCDRHRAAALFMFRKITGKCVSNAHKAQFAKTVDLEGWIRVGHLFLFRPGNTGVSVQNHGRS
jgi:hypothetical protein